MKNVHPAREIERGNIKASRIGGNIFGLVGLILTGLDFTIYSSRVITIGAASMALYCPVVKRPGMKTGTVKVELYLDANRIDIIKETAHIAQSLLCQLLYHAVSFLFAIAFSARS